MENRIKTIFSLSRRAVETSGLPCTSCDGYRLMFSFAESCFWLVCLLTPIVTVMLILVLWHTLITLELLFQVENVCMCIHSEQSPKQHIVINRKSLNCSVPHTLNIFKVSINFPVMQSVKGRS